MPSTESLQRTNKTIKKLAGKVAAQVIEDIDEEIEEIEDPIDDKSIDIFVGAAQDILKMGEHPVFYVEKNGSMLSVKQHPYSWELLQKEFGPGSYHVTARIKRTGIVKKHQTLQIADPKAESLEFGFTPPEEPISEKPVLDVSHPNFFQLMMMKNDMEEKNRLRQQEQEEKNRIRQQEFEAKMEQRKNELEAKFKEAERAKESSNTDIFKMMLNQQQDTAKIQAENARQIQLLMSDNQKTVITLMTTMMAKPKDEGLKPHELMKMLSDAEKHGYERMERMTEKVEKLAEARAEEIASRSDSGEGADDSLIKTVVKGFMPLISQAINSPQAMQRQPSPQEIAAYENHQRLLAQQRLQQENRAIEQRNRQAAQPTSNRPAKVAQSEVTAQNPVPLPKHPVGVPNGAVTNMKEKIKTLVVPKLAEALTNGVSPVISAENCRTFLAEQGITLKVVLENFTLNDMLAIAEEYKLPEEVKPWLKEFHDYLSRFEAQSKQPVAETVELQQ